MATKKKPAEQPKKTPKPSGQKATSGMKERLDETVPAKTFKPSETERVARAYVKRRIGEMQDFREGLGIERKWQEADNEYIPHELDFGTTRKRFETNQDTGLRSRLVPVGDVTQQWRQASSAPILLAKIQTALSLIVDQMPEADLVPLLKKFEKTTDLAYSLWKRNWSVTNARNKLKLIVFDLAKYGWAAQRTYPRVVKYPKRVLTEKDPENPENDLYAEKELTWFNDVDRQPLNVFKTWIDELAKPYDPYSTNEAYYEMDFSHDEAAVLFGEYPNWEFVPKNAPMIRQTNKTKTGRTTNIEENKQRQDVVTIGYFESRHKDLYCIYVPSVNIPLYLSPLPNDDGYLSISHTMWVLRKSNLPYGVSLWEIIRQNKQLFDKMKNMTMDQLVLSIMKFGFFAGTNTALGDGKIEIVPGQARQLTSSTGKAVVKWMEIRGRGVEAWMGLLGVSDMMDSESGISAELEGQQTNPNTTLGEANMNREAALKRLKVPLDNIAYLIDQDAYLSLSWMSQIYSTATVMEFASEEEMMAFEKENDLTREKLFGTPKLNDAGENDGFQGPYEAHYLPQLALHLEDSDGQLKRSKDSKFFQVGTGDGQIDPKDLKWRGIFKTRPRSIIDQSETIATALKSEMANMLIPLMQQPPELVARAAQQLCKTYEEDPKDWLPDSFIKYLETGQVPPPPGGAPAGPGAGGDPLAALMAAAGGGQGTPAAGGAAAAPAVGGQGPTIQNQTGNTPAAAPTVVPKGQTSAPNKVQLGGGIFKRPI